MKKHLNKAFIALVILVALLVCRHFFRSGYFATDDGQWAVVRLASMRRVLKSGQFPARWSYFLNHGYGYPLFNYTYPMPYYLGVLPSGFLGLVNTIKLEFVTATIISGLGMYFFAKESWGKLTGLFASAFYLIAPFRLVNLYVRGSLGETWAMALYPWIFWAISRFSKNKKTSWAWLSGTLMALLILSHNVSALIFFPLVLVYLVSRSSRATILMPFVVALGLSCFFWFPALTQTSLIKLSQVPLSQKTQHFLSLKKLVSSSWQYGSPTANTNFNLSLGWPILGAGLLGIFNIFVKKSNRGLAFFSLALLGLIFMLLPYSQKVWQLPLLRQVDFPWRLLGIASFFLSLVAASIARVKNAWPVALVALVLNGVIFLPKANPKQFIRRSNQYYWTNDATTTSAKELMPVWVKDLPTNQPQKPFSFKQNITLEAKKKVTLNQVYFPGWQVKANNEKLAIFPQEKSGLLSFELDAGKYLVEARYKGTKKHLYTNLISLGFLAWLILVGLRSWQNK